MTKLSGSKCLVTGGAGFIGSNLVDRLVSMGCQVRATTHVKKPLKPNPKVEYVTVDLMNAKDCARAVDGFDFVFMCSASTAGAAVMAATPLVQVTPNVIMNSLLMEASYTAKIKKFCFISSSAAYPDTGARPVKEDEMFIGDPYKAYYAVGWMKRYSEILCKMYAEKIKEVMPCTVIRPSNVYGPGDKFDPKTSHVTAALVRRVAQHENPFVVWGDGKDVKDLIYIDDFIDGLIKAVEHPTNYLAINISSGKGYVLRDVIDTLLKIDDYKVDVQYDSTKPTMIPVRLLDNTYAKELLNFEAKTKIEQGLAKTLKWFKENYGPNAFKSS